MYVSFSLFKLLKGDLSLQGRGKEGKAGEKERAGGSCNTTPGDAGSQLARIGTS